jgi:hypothetical protein
MTVKDYIAGKLSPLRIQPSEADWTDIERNVPLESEATEANIRMAYMALATNVLPFYLNMARSVSENGFSISFDGEGLRAFHAWLCKYLGISDTINAKPKITFL